MKFKEKLQKEKLQKETWKTMLKLINDFDYLHKFLKCTPNTPQYIIGTLVIYAHSKFLFIFDEYRWETAIWSTWILVSALVLYKVRKSRRPFANQRLPLAKSVIETTPSYYTMKCNSQVKFTINLS